MKGLIWTNKKFRKRTFSGHYRYVDGEREFILVAEQPDKAGQYRTITMESATMAKNAGWTGA